MNTLLPATKKFKSEHLLGGGGVGNVYSAIHSQFGSIAVKVAINNDRECSKLLVTEYKILRSLSHPGVIKLHDFGWLPDNKPYIIMDHLTNGELYSYCDQLPTNKRFQNLYLFFSAIEYLHQLGIIHRDLKGENILLNSSNLPILTDLGLAVNDQTAGRSGTLEYMAPEIIDNQKATAQSDIYSIGVILYRLATGELPIVSDDPLHLLSMKREIDNIDFTFIENNFTDRFRDTVRKCLDPLPEKRFKNIAELREQLLLDGLIENNGETLVSVLGHLEHHLYNFNTTFVKKNFSNLKQDYFLSHHQQAKSCGLINALSDYLLVNKYRIKKVTDEQIEYTREEHSSLIDFNISDASAQDTIEYSELDELAYKTILTKIFAERCDHDTLDKIYQYCNGNICLLKIILKDLEKSALITNERTGLTISTKALINYTLPQKYYEAISVLVPAFAKQYENTINFLSADHFDNPINQLKIENTLPQDHQLKLVELKILKEENFTFRKSYYRHYFYNKIEQSELKNIHQRWIKIIESTEILDKSLKNEQLFFHFQNIGDKTTAVQKAIVAANEYRNKNQPEHALYIIKSARELGNIENDNSYLKLLMLSADLAKDLGYVNQAFSDYVKIVFKAYRVSDLEMLAEAYKDLGDLYKAKRDYRRGNQALSHAVELYGKIGDELELSHCFNNIGNIHWINGDFSQAEFNYLTALEIQKRLGIKKDIASTLNNLGVMKHVQRNFSESIKLYKESMKIKREIEDFPELARSANNVSVAYYEIDDLQLAYDYLEESLQINKSLGLNDELLYNYENLYEIEYRLGDFDKAREALFSGLRLATQDDIPHRTIFITGLAALAMKDGNYGKAESLYKLANKYIIKITDVTISMQLNRNLAKFYYTLADFVTARKHLQIALENAKQLGDAKIEAVLIHLDAKIMIKEKNNFDSVLNRYHQARELLEDLPVKREKLEILIDIAELHLQQNNLETAREALQNALDFESFDGYQQFVPHLRYIAGVIELYNGKYLQAISILSEAVKLADNMKMYELLWNCHNYLGDALYKNIQYESALQHYFTAFEILKKLAANIKENKLTKKYLSDPLKINIADKLEEISQIVA